MIALLQDARYILRQIRRSPGFALTVILTLALGIGASTVVFSIVDAVLLKPLPFPHPDRLVEVQSLEGMSSGAARVNETSYPNFFDWRQLSKSFQSIAAYKSSGFTLSGHGDTPATRISGIMVTSDFFSTVGVMPELGRAFRRDEEQPGNRSVIIGSDLAQQEFGGSRNVLGKTIRLDDENYTVIGVMPRGFLFPVDVPDAQLWVTTAHDAEGPNASSTQRGYNQLDVVARLRDGVTLQQAQAELNTVQQGLALRYPDDDRDMTSVSLTGEMESVVGDVRQPLRILFAAVGVLLLIACANAAGLFLTRSSNRIAELSIRAALGASRRVLARHLLIEALSLALCGGLCGAGLAALVLQQAPRFLPANLVRTQAIAVNGGVLGFALLAALITGLVFGLMPAWRLSHVDPMLAMNEGRRGTTGSRTQHSLHGALVIGQTALSLVLLVGAGLLMRSFDRIMKVDAGFEPQHMLNFRVAAPEKRYSNEQRVALFNRILDRLRAIPGVQSATAAFPLPLTGGDIHISFSIDGQPVEHGNEPSARLSLVAPNFFETMRIALKHGRFFRAEEQNMYGQPVVIVNGAFAKKFFGDADAVGRRMTSGVGVGDESPSREIVGVVADVKRGNLMEADQPEYYIPIEQGPLAPPAIALRVAGNPASYESAVRAAVAEIDRGLPVYRFHPYTDDLARTTAQQRFQTVLIGAFAAIAMILAAIGLYALLSYMVVLRTPELGLRIALGAQRSNVLTLILRRGMILSALGLAMGLVVATALTRFLAGMLFGIKPLDLFTFASVSLVLLLAALIASLLPAWRAYRLDPIETLRST
jgi:predicted permease